MEMVPSYRTCLRIIKVFQSFTFSVITKNNIFFLHIVLAIYGSTVVLNHEYFEQLNLNMNHNLLPIITPVKIRHANRAHLYKFKKLSQVNAQVYNAKLKVTLGAAPVINCKVVISQKVLLLTLSLPYVCEPTTTEHQSVLHLSTQYGCFCSC